MFLCDTHAAAARQQCAVRRKELHTSNHVLQAVVWLPGHISAAKLLDAGPLEYHVKQ